MNYNNRTFYSINTNETLVTILHANVYSFHRHEQLQLHRLRAYETVTFFCTKQHCVIFLMLEQYKSTIQCKYYYRGIFCLFRIHAIHRLVAIAIFNLLPNSEFINASNAYCTAHARIGILGL